jgi:hypothetical protein
MLLAPAISTDAFGSTLVAETVTLFDNKLLGDSQPLLWDDQQTSGSATTSWHEPAAARQIMRVAASTAGTRTRQTYRRIPYQPGKISRTVLTGTLPTPAAGITAYFGRIDAQDGFAFGTKDGRVGFLLRSSSGGSGVVDRWVYADQWNLDSGRFQSIDVTQMCLCVIDYLWQGAGAVSFGLMIGGDLVWMHRETHAGVTDRPYISSPNLPMRYEISNSGVGPASTMTHVCTTVNSIGGHSPEGVVRAQFVGPVGTLSLNSTYAVFGIRQMTGYLDSEIEILQTDVFVTTSDSLRWTLRLNPTIAGSTTFAQSAANSAAETATGGTSNTVSGGTIIAAGYASQASPAREIGQTTLHLGSTLAGVRDQLWLCVTPLTNNLSVHAAVTWREVV